MYGLSESVCGRLPAGSDVKMAGFLFSFRIITAWPCAVVCVRAYVECVCVFVCLCLSVCVCVVFVFAFVCVPVSMSGTKLGWSAYFAALFAA